MPTTTATRTAAESLMIWTRAGRIGDLVSITVTLDLPAGVHIEPDEASDAFFHPTIMTVDGLADVSITYPNPGTMTVPHTDLSVPVLRGPVDFTIVARAPETDGDVVGTILFQPFVDGRALAPRSIEFVASTASTTGYAVLGAFAS